MGLTIPLGLTLLALAILFAGVRFSNRAGRPRLLRIGSAVAAAGLVALWALPYWLFSVDRGEWAMPMFIGVLVIAGSLIGFGLQAIARAFEARVEGRNDQLFDDFVRHNDLP
jgi:hypothetical protein